MDIPPEYVYTWVAQPSKVKILGCSVDFCQFLVKYQGFFHLVLELRQRTRKINDFIRAVKFCLFGSKDS